MTQAIGPYRLQPPPPDPQGDGTIPTPNAGPLHDLAQRALSYVHADALFESLAVTPPRHCEKFDDDHDFERCGNDKPIPSPVLFLRQSKDAESISAGDVHQGQAGDCALLATLAALASTQEGRALIRSAIVENRNAQGTVTSYTVTLHTPDSRIWPFGAKTFSEVKVTVEAPFVSGHALSRGEHDFVEVAGPHEVWPLVFEQAYAAVRGGYNQTCRGDFPLRAMEALTGRPAMEKRLGWLGYRAEQIAADCAAGKLVVLDTKEGVGEAHHLVESHAYQVVGTEVENGKLCFRLRNPWGVSDPGLIPYDELTKWFSSVHVGTLR